MYGKSGMSMSNMLSGVLHVALIDWPHGPTAWFELTLMTLGFITMTGVLSCWPEGLA